MTSFVKQAVKLAVPLLFLAPPILMGGATPTGVALTGSPNPSIFGHPVTLAAVVAPPTVSGSVTFYDGTSVLGTAKLTGGMATLTTVLLPSGSRSLKSYYGGDSNYAPSTSSTLAQIVNAVPGGGFQAAVTYGAGVGPYSVVVGDFNGDGKADLAVSDLGSASVSVLLGNGDGTFQAAANYVVGSYSYGVAAGDFNGDGKVDLAVANGYTVSVLLGNGDGTFRAAVSYGAGGSPIGIAAGDFNRDGIPDLAVTNLFGNTLSLLLGNGDGTFRTAFSYSTGNYPYGVVTGDFNGDGKADLAVANGGSNDVSVLLGNGDGTFQAALSLGTGVNPLYMAVGDLDGDGTTDIVVANHDSASVSVLLGKGDGTFRTAVNYGAGSNPYSVAIGDFNGDGKADLAVANSGGNNVSVFLGNGDGTFKAAVNYGAGNAPFSVAVGDFNEDGRSDLVVANSSGNNVSVLLAIAAAPDLSIVLTNTGNFSQGQSGGAYAITVSNVGHAPTSGMVTVTDTLPQGLAATDISGTGWTCVIGILTCTRGDPLAEFASYPVITVTVRVAVDAPSGVTNTVSVLGGGETNAANDSASVFITTFTSSQAAQVWSSLKSPFPANSADAELLMSDGTAMVHQYCSSNWFRLAPDSFGNYANGTWSQGGSMQPAYAPAGPSTAVLADGRLIAIGGEYNNPCTKVVDTNLGAIYDPTTNIWTPLPAPSGWATVGDASNVVLPDGQFLLAGPGKQIAELDPLTLSWKNLKSTAKADTNSEEGWTLLPDGTVLTVDIGSAGQSERYFPQTDTWAPAGNTVAPLVADAEIGPQVLRPNGTVFVTGATGHTAVYNLAASAWAYGPDFPVAGAGQLAVSDGPASLLPDGNVLVGATAFVPQLGQSFPPTFFFEFDGTRLNPVPAPPGTTNDSTYFIRLLLLPNGQVLFNDGPNINIYTPVGEPNPAWAPTIAAAPSEVMPGQTYPITGTQFNGLSQAVAYGDDYQAATNYPLARITNSETGHVFYCRTHNHSTMAVATGSAPVSTQFDVPPSIEMGPSTLVVVANGIASNSWNLIVTATPLGAGPTIEGLEGGGLSVPAVTAFSTNGYFTIFGANFAPDGTSRQLASSDIVSGFLPTNLASTCVNVGSARAFPTYVSSAQINAIAPLLSATGLAPVSVVANCGTPNEITSNTATVPLSAAGPEFLYWVQNNSGQNPVIAVDAVHGDYIGPPGLIPGLTFRPARAGDVLTIYGIGFGGTKAGPVPGLIPSAADSVPAGYSVRIGGASASASYVGVTPTQAGLYQVNVTVPAGIAPGNYPIVLNVNGASTPARALLAIGQ